MKRNCWEFMECGREDGGVNARRLGVCPASTEYRLDGVHGGMNAGRACWLISGTLCGEEEQGTFVQKQDSCTHCVFYLHVGREEKTNFKIALELIHLLTD